jgi:phosphohistidine phosphatase
VELWLLRHAEAEDRSETGRDEDRALTAKGAKRAAAVAKGLAALSPEIDVLLTSPLARARETAEPVARALEMEMIETDALRPDREPSEIVRELERRDRSSVLLVGHQPHLGRLLGLLVLGEEEEEIPLRKSAVARVAWEPDGDGRLEALLPPKVLERLGGKPGS